jgi:hypothetical protein
MSHAGTVLNLELRCPLWASPHDLCMISVPTIVKDPIFQLIDSEMNESVGDKDLTGTNEKFRRCNIAAIN